MTKTRYRVFETHYPYFITCTVKGWLPIFTNQAATDIILDSWRYLQQERGFRLFAWVVLENHLHFIGLAEELPDVIHRFKT